ncbi:hypothetical protein [Marvinbryantia sp.]|uniref:hypothetical protein n=2 Tax=Marvinbryantia sp. TaxID=2496532 RepID=UPI0025CF758C|nr:hypothetical protein [uncultured Marvinbryantia sp.]
MMKNRKYLTKGLAGVLAAGMIAGGALTAFAAENDTLTVTYAKDSRYVLSIPKTVTLSETVSVAAEPIALTESNVASGKKVAVTVASGIAGGKVTLTDSADATNTITSTVSLSAGGEAIADNAVVAEFKGNSLEAETGTGTLHFAALGTVGAGSYSGQIVFTSSVVDSTN